MTMHRLSMDFMHSHGSLSLLFVMKVMTVWHFVSDSHKVMTAVLAVFAFKFLLWRRFLCNFIDIYCLVMVYAALQN